MGRNARHTRRRQWLIRGMIVLPLAVLTTIAVTWAIAWFFKPDMRTFDAQVLLHEARPSRACTIWEFRGKLSVKRAATRSSAQADLERVPRQHCAGNGGLAAGAHAVH